MLRAGGLLVLAVREIERTRVRYKREPVVTRSAEGVYFRAEARFLGDVVHGRGDDLVGRRSAPTTSSR